MTNFKLNLKGQFNNSQTAVNADCQPTVSRRSRLMSVLCLLTLLTLGVGNAWGADVQQNAIIYMDNSAASWDYSNIYFVINSTNGYPMTAVANTKLYVHKRSAGTWSGYSNVRFFAATSSWGGDDASMKDESNMVSYGANLTNTQTNYGFNGNNYYVIKLDKAGTKTNSSTRANLSTSYIGDACTSMNKTITVKAKVSTDDGSSYSETTSPGTLSASSYKFTTYNSCASAQSLSSNTISCGYTATTTLTAQSTDPTGYTFVGWYNASGTQQTTSKTLTIYPTADATYYAYYKAKQTTITLNGNDGTGGSASVTGTYGQALPSFTNYTREGYKLDGYYTDASTGTKIINADGTLVANVSGYTDSSNKWARNNTTGITLYAHWLKTTVTGTMTPNPATANTSTTFTFNITFSNWVSGQRYIIINPAGGFLSGPTAISSNSVEWTSGTLSYNAGTHVFKLRICNSTNTEAITDDYDINLAVSAATYTVTVNAGVGGSASPSSVSASPDTWSSNITATPNAGYQFVNWTSSGGGISINGATANPTQIKATSTGGTLTANFSAATYRVTLDNQSATTAGTEYVDATYNTTTLTTISKPTKTNYTFGGYYTATSGGGTQIIDANGNWLASKSGFTDDSKKSIITENKNLYAKWTETKYDVTVSCTNPTTGDFTMAGTYQVGNVTAVRLAAGAPNSGYKWGTWVLGDGVTLVSGSLTNSGEIYVKATKNSTVTFTYDENLESEWIVAGGDKIVTTGTTWRTTADANNKMLKKPGHSTESVVYFTVPVSAICEGKNNSNYQFKIYNTSTGNWYGLGADGSSYYLLKAEDGTEKSLNGDKNIELRAYILGDYEFKLDYSTATPKLTVTWPSVNQLQIYTANESSTGDAAIGNWSWDGTSGTISTKELTLQAKTQYKFKVIYNSDFYGFKTADNPTNPMTIANHTDWRLYDDGGNCYLYAPVTGTYTFRFNSNNSGNTTLTVDFPEASRIIYGVGTLPGGGAVTVSPSFASEDYVLKTQAITFTRGDLVAGYVWKGWFNNAEGTGVALGTGATYTSAADTRANNTDFSVYACYDYATYSITLDQTGRATAGSQTSVTGTYNSAMPDISGAGKLPTAPDGYCFMGYWDEANGNGTQYYNADGTSAHIWDKTSTATLYAYYRKAVITALTFDAAAYEPEGTVGVTPTVSPTPTGTTVICWEVQYANGNPLDPQPTITSNPSEPGAKITFPASATSGTYKVQATLRIGSSCDGGTELSTQVMNFQVAGEHTVTVQYKCGSENIKASTSMEGVKPLEWSDEITPPAIFGYTFLRWVAIDGVSITTDNGTTTMDSTTTSAIKIKAIYDGKLIARYTQNNIIYFKNTLGWSNVYVNLLDGDYWNNDNGSGNENKANRNLQMSLVDGTTDIYYYDYGNKSTTRYVSFTAESYTNTQYFYQSSPNVAHVVFPTRYADALTTDKGTEGGFYAGTPMFVPLEGQTPQSKNSGRAYYYNSGYWTKYTSGTGYSLKIYNAAGDALLKDIPFTSSDELMPMEAVVNLDASTAYKFELMREGDVYYGNDNDMTYENHGQDVPWEMSWKDGGHKCGLTTNAAGEYTFHLTYSDYNNEYRLRMSYDYPVSSGDYRVLYKDGVHTNWHPSAIVPKVNNGKDTVSFFIRPGNASKAMKIQQATVDPSTGTVSWSSVTDVTSALTAARCPKDSVYNICLTMDGSGNISVENVEAYTGNFYIRTGAANNKWDNYKSTDHMMTYSEYSEQNSDYTHYWMAHIWADNNVNLSFVVANDYSPCISDTMTRATYRGGDAAFVDESGVTNTELNIRYMWHRHDNSINRAYLSPAQASGSKFLVLRGNSTHNLRSESGALLTGESEASPGNNHGGGADCMQFIDDENWIYETTVKVAANSYVKLYAKLGSTYFYYRGTNDETFDASHAVQLITGAVTDTLKVRVIYDFKTDRLLAAYLPEGTISEDLDINADVMFIREHQGDISQLTFSGTGSKISKIKTAYAVMRFNKWTLNNKSKEAPHSPLASPLSRYERDVFYVSFPFRVNLNEVFGFGTYGVHWIMEEYDGAGRAQKGFWKDSPSFWKFITNRQGKYLEPNVGYILALDLDELGEDASVWNNNVQNIELFFPSTTDLPDITSGTVTHELPAHTCTINRNTPQGDRRIADSHWNIMAVPTYVNTNNISFANTDWTTGPKDPAAGKLGPNFLYTWNPSDNTLTPTSASGFTYHAMHAYTVQYYGDVTWTTSVSPSAIVAREKQAPRAYEWCLEIQQDSLMIDRTYVRMTDEEEVTTGFEFGYDMSKGIEWSRANVYSFITTAESTEMAAGNTMPLETEQTTIVPLGVYIVTAGDYTFAMPEGTNGVGVTLVDTEANVRTSLSALDYTVSLEAGEYTGRFVLEISPIQNTPTDLGNVQGDNVQGTKARKVMIDGIMYIVKDGKMYDARGARVE